MPPTCAGASSASPPRAWSSSPWQQDDADNVLAAWLAQAGRTIQPDQRAEVLDKFTAAGGLPLYLKVAFEAATRWHSYDPPGETVLAGTTDGLVEQLFDRLCRDHDSIGEKRDPATGETTPFAAKVVECALGYLAAGAPRHDRIGIASGAGRGRAVLHGIPEVLVPPATGAPVAPYRVGAALCRSGALPRHAGRRPSRRARVLPPPVLGSRPVSISRGRERNSLSRQAC